MTDLNPKQEVMLANKKFKIYNYCRESSVFGKTGMKKWFKLAEPYVTYRYVEYREFKNYSEGEIVKLKDYDKVTDEIIKDVLSNIDNILKTKIIIEGFSFGSRKEHVRNVLVFDKVA